MLTAIGSWRLRSSDAHYDRELARREEEKEKEEKEEKTPQIKSNNPHLAGVEKGSISCLEHWSF